MRHIGAYIYAISVGHRMQIYIKSYKFPTAIIYSGAVRNILNTYYIDISYTSQKHMRAYIEEISLQHCVAQPEKFI